MKPAHVQQLMVNHLISRGWLADARDKPQSNSAQAFAIEAFRRLPNMDEDDATTIVQITEIILEHNHDPNDTDVIGTAIHLLKYIKAEIL